LSKRLAWHRFELALNLLRPKGKLVLKSTFNETTEIDAARIVVDEISIVGSRCGRFMPAVDLLAKGAIDVDSLISESIHSLKAFTRCHERNARYSGYASTLKTVNGR
jgi:threonine dehydrogenase-like Zn-dependent dehydrogenase